MANKQLKTIKFPHIDNVYSVQSSSEIINIGSEENLWANILKAFDFGSPIIGRITSEDGDISETKELSLSYLQRASEDGTSADDKAYFVGSDGQWIYSPNGDPKWEHIPADEHFVVEITSDLVSEDLENEISDALANNKTIIGKTTSDLFESVKYWYYVDNATDPYFFSVNDDGSVVRAKLQRTEDEIYWEFSSANDSPNLTGIPTSPTAEIGTNTNQIATTKFVNDSLNNAIGNSALSIKINGEDAAEFTANAKEDVELDIAVPTRVSDLANDSEFTTQTQVQQQIATAVGGVNSFDVLIVEQLPTENIKDHTIYFIPKTGDENDIYDEYMYINDEWEKIGNTQISLADYATKTYVDSRVNTKQDIIDSTHQLPSDYVSGLADVATTGDYADLNNKPVNVSAFNNDANYQTLQQVSQAIQDAVIDASGDITDSLAQVAFSGNYNDLINTPDSAIQQQITNLQQQVQTKQDAITSQNKLDSDLVDGLSEVATTGDYNDLINTPSIPTKTSDILNDSGYITSADIPEGAAASTTAPKMDGVAFVGSELAFARGDHIHPSDSSKVDVTSQTSTSKSDILNNDGYLNFKYSEQSQYTNLQHNIQLGTGGVAINASDIDADDYSSIVITPTHMELSADTVSINHALLADGAVAVTQQDYDSSTKIATTEFVQTAASNLQQQIQEEIDNLSVFVEINQSISDEKWAEIVDALNNGRQVIGYVESSGGGQYEF